MGVAFVLFFLLTTGASLVARNLLIKIRKATKTWTNCAAIKPTTCRNSSTLVFVCVVLRPAGGE